MREREFNKSINEAFSFLVGQKLSDWSQFPHHRSLPVIEKFRRVALDSSRSYEDVYVSALSSSAYNALLFDGGFFQFSLRDGAIRLAYYPNPFIQVLDADGIEEGLEGADGDVGQQSKSGCVCVRYDFDKKAYVEGVHPSAHLHFGHASTCRIPVEKIYSPLCFSALVVRHFCEATASGSGGEEEVLSLLIRGKARLSLVGEELFGPRDCGQPFLR